MLKGVYMNDSITINLCALVKDKKMILLRPDELIKDIAPNIDANDVDDFLIFQGALRKKDIGSILLKADMGNDKEKNDAVNYAIEELKSLQIPYMTSEKIVKRLVTALEWNKPAECKPLPSITNDKPSLSFNENIVQNQVQNTPIDKRKKILIASASIILLCICIFFGVKHLQNKEDTNTNNAVTQEPHIEKKVPEMTTNLSLGGLDLGLTVDEMHNRLGNETSTKTDGAFQYYYYDNLKAGIQNGKITSLVSDGSAVKTKSGIHEGSSLDDVIQAYGNNYMRMAYDNLFLYEYEFEGIHGQKGILRFAINQSDNKVNYISVRIKDAPKAKAEPKEITVTYLGGGKNSPFKLSDTVITMHVGQTLHLMPVDKNTEPNFLRIMTDGNPNKMGDIQPENCLTIKSAGVLGYKGASTETLITAQGPGKAIFTVVPNNGGWEQAKKMTVTIVK